MLDDVTVQFPASSVESHGVIGSSSGLASFIGGILAIDAGGIIRFDTGCWLTAMGRFSNNNNLSEIYATFW